jgi:hypothetical protein
VGVSVSSILRHRAARAAKVAMDEFDTVTDFPRQDYLR